jgi:hypothetical protein
MLNKSVRNKSSKKKYRQRTKKNYKYGGQQKQYGKSSFYADYPNATENDIKNSIGFEIPADPKFNPGKDNYKFLEMADRDLTTDMETKLNKYESGFTSYNAAAQYCKYMYLIRATHPTSGNTVLHYICNHRSVEMFQLVWPYYLILYNKDFPDLLAYYINKKNKSGLTPLGLLNKNATAMSTNNLDYKGKWLAAATINAVKNVVSSVTDIKKTALRYTRRFGNGFGGRVKFIKSVLEKFGNIMSSGSESTNGDEPDLTPEEDGTKKSKKEKKIKDRSSKKSSKDGSSENDGSIKDGSSKNKSSKNKGIKMHKRIAKPPDSAPLEPGNQLIPY